ncbi:phosphatase PAP2 family protein [Formosa sediminum]|uniref:Phosphatase PAP2 family protein n=1 Tax=Formosa sediminum TaxID=2594004 RepID=A0A516GRH3_9FLAO|nr:phosphatase PAP2 family protein [Formosa sediminum]QDO94103.1 phosphatase PAP2 family protein [Formosa sediminum]
MFDKLLNTDKELFLYLNNLGSETWDPIWLAITHEYTFAPLYALLLYLIYKKRGVPTLVISLIVIVCMVTFTDQMTNVVKDTVQRFRPCRTEGVMEYMRYIAARCGRYGFFSGHSSNTMAAAIFAGLVLKPFYKNAIYFLMCWSLIVAYSRVYVGVHYPLDLVCGLTFGALCGFGFYKLFTYIVKRRGLATF